MVEVAGTLGKLKSFKALVAGDFFLDTYTIGKARRISPEAPVAIIHAQETTHLPGGAGNVILNLIALGGEVVAFGRTGKDASGQILMAELEESGAMLHGLFVEDGYPTGIKNRVIANNQQIVRIDHEVATPLSKHLEKKAMEQLPSLIQEVDIVAISDYAKGFLSRPLLQEIIRLSNERNIPIIADPKGTDFTKYKGVTVIKPNFGEAVAAAGLGSEAPLERMASVILNQADAKYLMITRSEEGITIFQRDGTRYDFPVRIREIKDVTGAGDTVLATLTCALASDLPISSAAHLCNIAAGIAIERFGCACVTLADIAQRALDEDIDDKVFEEEHLFALEHILENRRFIVLGFEAGQYLTTEIFREIRNLASNKERDILVYLREQEPSKDFIDLIASLHDVRYIIVHGESLRKFCEKIPPEEVYIARNNKVLPLDHAKALLYTV